MPFIQANNIQFYYESVGQGEPIVLIHGLGGSHEDWEFQMDALQQQYRVIRFDLRGHGQTDKPKEPYSIALFAQDLAALVQSLAPEGAHIVGHSLGGMIAFQFAVDFPNLVRTLVVVNSAPTVASYSLKFQLLFLWRNFDIRLFGLPHLGKQIAKVAFPNPNQMELKLKFLNRWMRNSPDAYLNTLKAFRGWSVIHRIHEIQVPSLIVTADQDYSPVQLKRTYAQLMPNAEVVVIPNSRHLTIADQPQKFNEALIYFLKKQ